MKTKSNRRHLLAIAASSLVAISSAHAQSTLYWDGGSTDILTDGNGASGGTAGTWDTTLLNWDAGASPHIAWNNSNNDTAVFAGTAGTVTLGTGITAGGLTFNTTGYTITGSTLTLAGASAPVLNVSTGTSTISSDISGTNGLEKTGGGSLIFSGTNNTYSGTTTISAGTLEGHKTITDGPSPFGTSTIQLNAGTLTSRTIAPDGAQTFTFGNEVTVGGNATIDYGRIGGAGSNKTHAYGNLSIGSNTLSLTAGNINHTISFTGATLTGNAVFNGATIYATTNIGAITETGGPRNFTKSGGNTLRLTGVNTYTGDTTITGGTLQIGSNNGALLGGIGGNYAGNISITSGTLSIASNVNQTLSGIISGAGNLIKENSGTLFLGNSNTYTGKTTISPTTSTDATISIASFNSVNGGTPLLASSSLGAPTTVANGTIDLGSVAAGRRAAIIYTGAGETTDRVINFRFNNVGSQHSINNTGAGLLKFTSAAIESGSTDNGGIILGGDGNGEFSQGLNFGFGNLVKNGNGTWTLGGPVNSGNGTNVLTVNAGTLALQKKTSLHNGDTTRWTAAKINIKSGATLALNVDSGDVDGLSADSLDALLTNIYGGTSTSQGLQAGAILGLDTSNATGGSFTQSNAITNSTGTGGGALGLTKLGTGTLVLDKANTYTGQTRVAGGTLKLGADNVLPDGSAVSIGSATLDADTRTDTLGTLNVTGSSVINLGSGAALVFADSSAGGTGEWAGTLNLIGFVSGSSLNFGSPTGLTAQQLSKISATGFSNFSLDAEGDLIADFGGGPGPLDKFAISAISSPQTVGMPITGITITAQDASNQTVTSFNGTVTFSGSGGFSGTSGSFTAGVLTGVSVTPTFSGSNLTLVVTDGVSGKTGTQTIATIQTQYQAWASGAAFGADANGDGISNGLAFLLGASGPGVNALNKLPVPEEISGGLRLTFQMLPASARGTATLSLEHSNTLANGSWTTIAVPDSDNTVGDVVFTITDSNLSDPANPLDVTATIPVSKANGGKLFGRVKGVNP